jgi:hypothetical protein
MRVLIGCEFSGIVRDAFITRGHDAMSCDLQPTERRGPHYQGDIFDAINDGWDLFIVHPPCDRLAVSGARWLYEKPKWAQEQRDAIAFVERLWDAPIKRKCIENPVGILSTRSKLGRASQYIDPWMFGHTEQKHTGLWLQELPLLHETKNVYNDMMRLPKRERERIWNERPGQNRKKNRSRTYQGIADAMAEQWGNPKQQGFGL